jgi:simple sugar transport system ATP-binding protein
MVIEARPVAVEMRAIVKRFPGVLANDRVELVIRSGEVHALLGENGAGKTTLMSALCGLYRPDEGEIYIARSDDERPQPADIGSPRDAIQLGVGMVHQHFRLVANQTVAENVILGLDGTPLLLDMKSVGERLLALSEKYGLRVDPETFIWQLSVGEQQRVEILKLLFRGAEILVLDEPTAVLTPNEAAELGKTLRRMCAEGKAVVFISHKLDEVMSFCARVTVWRDGRNVAALATGDTDKAALAELMVGREVLFRVEKEDTEIGEVVLSVEEVCALNDKGFPALQDVSLQVASGEVLGIAGVSGNGQRELAETVTGLRGTTGGRVFVRGRELTDQTPLRFIRAGVGHIPGDRLGMGLAGNLPVSDNLIMKAFRQAPLAAGPFLLKPAVSIFADRLIKAFDVLTPSRSTPARNLSGGNQQKAILAREISTGEEHGDVGATVLVAVQPTRGLDAGATESVRRALLEQRARGSAILLVSEDLDELLALSDRIAVMHAGRIMGVVTGSETSMEEVGLMMAGEMV